MMKFLDSFFQKLKLPRSRRAHRLSLSASTVEKVARMLANTDDSEFTCEQVFDLIDRYAELEINGEDAAKLMPMIKKHLEICISCNEEYEVLWRMLEARAS
jgi:hypothetical protein